MFCLLLSLAVCVLLVVCCACASCCVRTTSTVFCVLKKIDVSYLFCVCVCCVCRVVCVLCLYIGIALCAVIFSGEKNESELRLVAANDFFFVCSSLSYSFLDAMLLESVATALLGEQWRPGDEASWCAVPYLSAKQLRSGRLQSNMLVRYRGMVQDMHDPEYVCVRVRACEQRNRRVCAVVVMLF